MRTTAISGNALIVGTGWQKMKCCNCPYKPGMDYNGEYGECIAPEEYYTELSDGEEGCTLTRAQLKKLKAELMDTVSHYF